MPNVKNINIVYNVNDSQVKTATTSVTQAKLATDQLTQSALNLGTAGSASSTKWASDIYTVKQQMQLLQTQIELTSRSDTARMNSLIGQYNDAKKQVDDFNAKLKESTAITQNMGVQLSSLYNTVKLVFTAGLIKETISASIEMAKLNGQVQGVKAAFDKLPNSIALMEDLKSKTHGTLDELTLMQKAVQAQNFKIPLEQLGTLLEFAAIKAQQTGLDVDYLVNSLITGLGRNSVRLLDNLQISITELRQKTTELGSTQAAVFFLVNKQMQTMGEFVETDAVKVDKLSASWKNLKIIMADSGFWAGIVSISDRIVTNLTNIIRGADAAKLSDSKLFASQDADKYLRTLNGITQDTERQSNLITDEITRIKQLIVARESDLKVIQERKRELMTIDNPDYDPNKIKLLNEQQKVYETRNEIAKQEILILQQKQKQLSLNNVTDGEQLGILAQIDKQIDDLNKEELDTLSPERITAIEVKIAELKKLRDAYTTVTNNDMGNPNVGLNKDQTAELQKDLHDGFQKIFQESRKEIGKFNDDLQKDSDTSNKLFIKGLKLQYKEREDEEEAHQQRLNKIMKFAGSQLYTNARQIANELIQVDVNRIDQQISDTQSFYDEQKQLAGNNQEEVKRLDVAEQARLKKLNEDKVKAQKTANIRKIEIDTAANVIRSVLENGGIPYGLPFGAIAAAMGLAQIALVNKFAKGVIDLKGPGTSTSDSIPSMLSRGESVMTSIETKESIGILKSIRAKKLNDRVLEKLIVPKQEIVAQLNDKNIINEMRNNRSPDFIKIGSMIYEVKQNQSNMRRIIRSKSFSR